MPREVLRVSGHFTNPLPARRIPTPRVEPLKVKPFFNSVLAVGWGSALSRHTRENAQCLFKVPKQVLGGAESNTLLKILSQFF